MTAIETRRFDKPDDLLDMEECGGIAIVKMETGATGMHAVFEPGWTWEKNEKPCSAIPIHVQCTTPVIVSPAPSSSACSIPGRTQRLHPVISLRSRRATTPMSKGTTAWN